MDVRKRLFSWRDPYDIAGTEALFVQAVKENISHHRACCLEYDKLVNHAKSNEKALSDGASLCEIPVLPTFFLKKKPLYSMDPMRGPIRATSSGTNGIVSRAAFDAGSLKRGYRMVRRVFHFHGLTARLPVRYLVLGYQPSPRNTMGAAQTAYGVTKLFPALSRDYALKDDGQAYRLDIPGLMDCVKRYAGGRAPVWLVGFPAYCHALLSLMEHEGLSVTLPKGSKILLGGGWKAAALEKADMASLRGMAKERLGIGVGDCKEFFSAVEHPVAYCDCSRHHLHVPIYSRVIVRDCETLAPLPYGKPGLLSFITPLVDSMPLTCVMTDDLAVLHPAEECGCGINSPYFTLLGRADLSGIETCAAGAASALTGGVE